jgi:hypothetical protein
LLAAWANGAPRHQLDDCGQCERPRRLVTGKVAVYGSPDLRKHLCKTGKPASLSHLADPLPVRMIPVLQPPSGVAANSLNMGFWVGSVEHVLIRRRDGKGSEPSSRLDAPQRRSVGRDITKAAAVPDPSNLQLVSRHVGKAKAANKLHRRLRKHQLVCVVLIEPAFRFL